MTTQAGPGNEFLWGNVANGYLSATPLTPGAATHTNTTLDTISPTVTAPKGTYVSGTGIPAPNFITAQATAAASVTLVTAATASASITATFQNFPVLIGGEASALTNGSAVTSSYWNATGVFRQSADMLEALFSSVFFMAGGAFTPSAGGVLSGWWLPSFDGGTTFEAAISTPSSTVAAISRGPDFIIPLDNAAYAAGNIRWAAGRLVRPPPESFFKTIVQNNSGVTMPSTWMIAAGPVTPVY